MITKRIIEIRDVEDAILDQMKLSTTGFEYTSVFLQLVDEAHASSAWRWLSGGSLSKDELELLQVKRDVPQEGDFVLQALKTVLLLLNEVHNRPLILLLDELETISTMRPVSSRASYLDDLRHLIDETPNDVCIISTITPTAMAILFEESHPLTRRLFYRTRLLTPFDITKTRDLIIEYLKEGRRKYAADHDISLTEVGERLRKYEEPQLAPFSSSAIPTIRSSSTLFGYEEGNIGEVIRMCGYMLDAAVDEHTDLIEESFVKSHSPSAVENK